MTSDSIFRNVIVGVDGTEPALEACRQAARFAEPDAKLEAAAVVHLGEPTNADGLRREAEAALERALALLGPRARPRLLNGFAAEALREEAERCGATLLALGSHGHRRLTEILIGGVAGELLHTSPCSVLVVRAPRDPLAFPRAIVVGIDGHPRSDPALGQAERLARRLDRPLRVVAARRGRDVDLVRAHLRNPFTEELDERPVDALVDASHEADLVVVGSRGLHGVQALGSVSERVAHRAVCSVLVVRGGA